MRHQQAASSWRPLTSFPCHSRDWDCVLGPPQDQLRVRKLCCCESGLCSHMQPLLKSQNKVMWIVHVGKGVRWHFCSSILVPHLNNSFSYRLPPNTYDFYVDFYISKCQNYTLLFRIVATLTECIAAATFEHTRADVASAQERNVATSDRLCESRISTICPVSNGCVYFRASVLLLLDQSSLRHLNARHWPDAPLAAGRSKWWPFNLEHFNFNLWWLPGEWFEC